jgi:X-X-X-Leu-X-X-Gly heptad repeat protein
VQASARNAPPGADKVQNGAGELTAGAVKIETDVHIKPAPGVYKVDDGAQKLAAGAVQLSAALAPAAAGIAENYLADGAIALHGGAAQLADGTGQLADGTVQLRGHRGANNDPQAGTGTAALVQALKLLQAAASDPGQGLVPCPDRRRHGYPAFERRRRLALQHGRRVGRGHGPGTPGALGLGSAGAFFVLRKNRPPAEAA